MRIRTSDQTSQSKPSHDPIGACGAGEMDEAVSPNVDAGIDGTVDAALEDACDATLDAAVHAAVD